MHAVDVIVAEVSYGKSPPMRVVVGVVPADDVRARDRVQLGFERTTKADIRCWSWSRQKVVSSTTTEGTDV